MIDREKFIEWVVEVYPNAIWSPAQLDALQRFASLAQAEAFERADKACEALRLEDGDGQHSQWYVGIDSCREAISALKEK